MLSEPNISYKPFWSICRPLKSWRANSPNPIQIYCANIKSNVDLQLSGHTHNGQMFPLSYSCHLQPDFAGNYGKETFKNYTKIISSGLVGWGFPIRTEGICEYVVVNITPKK